MRISDWSSEVCSSDLLALIDSATPAILQPTAAHWLSGGDHTLVIEPSETALSSLPETPFANRASGATDDAVPTVDPKLTVVKSHVDRRKGEPEAHRNPAPSIPAMRRPPLSNDKKD